MAQNFYAAAARLPQQLARRLLAVGAAEAAAITEIRLRSGCPVAVTLRGTVRFVTAEGKLVPGNQTLDGPVSGGLVSGGPAPGGPVSGGRGLAPLSHRQLQECFVTLCRYSVFTYENQLRRGYFTLPGGHRVGVAAQAVWQGEQLLQPQNVTALALRIARRHPLVEKARWAALLQAPQPRLLIAGLPGSGKTTVLRALAALLSAEGRRLAVLDERGELFPLEDAGFCFAIPWNCDVLSGYPKALAMQQALRALAPQLFLCDELGSGEVDGLLDSLHAGVGYVATVHAGSWQELCAKPLVRQLLAAGALEQAVLLRADRPGCIDQCRRWDAPTAGSA